MTVEGGKENGDLEPKVNFGFVDEVDTNRKKEGAKDDIKNDQEPKPAAENVTDPLPECSQCSLQQDTQAAENGPPDSTGDAKDGEAIDGNLHEVNAEQEGPSKDASAATESTDDFPQETQAGSSASAGQGRSIKVKQSSTTKTVLSLTRIGGTKRKIQSRKSVKSVASELGSHEVSDYSDKSDDEDSKDSNANIGVSIAITFIVLVGVTVISTIIYTAAASNRNDNVPNSTITASVRNGDSSAPVLQASSEAKGMTPTRNESAGSVTGGDVIAGNTSITATTPVVEDVGVGTTTDGTHQTNSSFVSYHR